MGASTQETWRLIAELWRQPCSPAELQALYQASCLDCLVSFERAAFLGMQETLRYYWGKGVVLIIASSSSYETIRRMLKETGIKPYICHIISGEMFKESKPAPDIYLRAIELSGYPSKACIAVEDSTYGIAAAKAAGLEVAAVRDTRFGMDQRQADFLIDSVVDIRRLECLKL